MNDDEYRPFPRELARDGSHGDVEVPLALALVEAPGAPRVLEIGCGVGASLAALRRGCAPSRLVGVDVDAEALRLAGPAARAHGATLVRADVRALPFVDGAFDLVVDFGTCFHIGQAGRALAEVSRVLGPGGLFLVESRLNQTISHPVRSWGRAIPWSAAEALRPHRRSLMWQVRRKADAEARCW